jgi:hypothetical protein
VYMATLRTPLTTHSWLITFGLHAWLMSLERLRKRQTSTRFSAENCISYATLWGPRSAVAASAEIISTTYSHKNRTSSLYALVHHGSSFRCQTFQNVNWNRSRFSWVDFRSQVQVLVGSTRPTSFCSCMPFHKVGYMTTFMDARIQCDGLGQFASDAESASRLKKSPHLRQ